MRVAFATRDRVHVDEQLRRASHLVVFEVDAAGASHVRTCAFPADSGQRTEERIRAIAGSAIVYVSVIGPSAAARLASRGIRVATAAGARIEDLLAGLRQMLARADAERGDARRPGAGP